MTGTVHHEKKLMRADGTSMKKYWESKIKTIDETIGLFKDSTDEVTTTTRTAKQAKDEEIELSSDDDFFLEPIKSWNMKETPKLPHKLKTAGKYQKPPMTPITFNPSVSTSAKPSTVKNSVAFKNSRKQCGMTSEVTLIHLFQIVKRGSRASGMPWMRIAERCMMLRERKTAYAVVKVRYQESGCNVPFVIIGSTLNALQLVLKWHKRCVFTIAFCALSITSNHSVITSFSS